MQISCLPRHAGYFNIELTIKQIWVDIFITQTQVSGSPYKKERATRKREISAHRATEEETQRVTPIVLSDFCSIFEDVASKIETQ